MAAGFLLASAVAWNVALGTVQLLLPLFAYELGLSNVAIGSIISIPIAFQLLVRVAAGPAADRFGERNLLLFCHAVMAAAGLVFLSAQSYLPLLLANFTVILSRGLYFSSAQALAAGLPGERSVQLGRLNAMNRVGLLGGTVGSGLLAAAVGLRLAITLLLVVAGLTAWLAAFRLPDSRRPATAGRRESPWQHIGPLVRRRPMYFALLCAFAGAQPMSLGQSFYPVYLAGLGYASEVVGPVVAMRFIGAIAVGLLLAKLVVPQRRVALATACLAATGLGVGLTPTLPGLAALATFLGIIGMVSAVMELYYQLIASEEGGAAHRASGLALGGLGWSGSHLITPIAFGFLADNLSLPTAFRVWALVLFALAALVAPAHRWAFGRPEPEPQASNRAASQ